MPQPPPIDPAWRTMRAKHQDEINVFKHMVDVQKRDFDRQVDAAYSVLLAKHSQQEREFWQHAPNALGRAAPAPPPVAPKIQTTTSKPSTPKNIPHQQPGSSSDHRRQIQLTAPAPAPARRPGQPIKPPSAVSEAQSQHNTPVKHVSTGEVKPPKPVQASASDTKSCSRPDRKQECEIVDLCSDNEDNDVLVEATKQTYQKTTALPSAFRPGIPTATFQLFGERPAPVKREQVKVAESIKVQPCSPQPGRITAYKPASGIPSAYPRRGNPVRDSVTLNAVQSIATQQAPNDASHQRNAQAPAQSPREKAPRPLNHEATKPIPSLNQQLRDQGRLKAKDATLLVNKPTTATKKQQQHVGLIGRILEDNRREIRALKLAEASVEKNSDDDVDMEYMPLGKCNFLIFQWSSFSGTNGTSALLNMKAALKTLGVTTSKPDGDVESSAATPAKSTKTAADVERIHLPSPSQSIASTNTIRIDSEFRALLNSFKKPEFPTSGAAPNIHNYSSSSQAARRSVVTTPLPEKILQDQREVSLASRISSMSRSSRKRKEVDLSDEEQSDSTPLKTSSFTKRKQTASRSSLGGASKVSTKAWPNRMPHPSPSLIRPVTKTTNELGFGKGTPITPATPPRSSFKMSTPSSNRTSTETTPKTKPKISIVTPGKRSAALKAQAKIQQISEAAEALCESDEIHAAFMKELPREGLFTADLGQRLRSMSITPVPTDIRPGGAFKNITMGSTLPKAAITAVQAKKDTDRHTRDKPLRDRATGRRFAVCMRNMDKLIGDDSDDASEDDLDISEFTYVNGIIIQVGQEDRLTEAQTKATSLGQGSS